MVNPSFQCTFKDNNEKRNSPDVLLMDSVRSACSKNINEFDNALNHRRSVRDQSLAHRQPYLAECFVYFVCMR